MKISRQQIVAYVSVLKSGSTSERAFARVHARAAAATPDPAAPLELHRAKVGGDWLDYNGHMTEFRYLQVFGDATDAFLGHIGMDVDYRARGLSVYTVETHIRHLAETGAGTDFTLRTTLLGFDARRIRLHHEMVDASGTLQATAEHMLMHVDTKARRACPMGAPLTERLVTLMPGQSALPAPDHAGRPIRDIGWPSSVSPVSR